MGTYYDITVHTNLAKTHPHLLRITNYDISFFLVKSLKLYIKLNIKTEVVRHHTHEISVHKKNSPGSPDKNTPLTGSC